MVTQKSNVANLRQSRRTRRTFSEQYKRNVLNTVAELVETAPNKISVFLKKEGLTWSGIQQWKSQLNGGSSQNLVSENILEPEVPPEESSGGVRNMRVGRANKYKNVTLDRLYTENIRLKERLAELEGSRKKAKLIVELQNKMLDILDAAPK